ncbi:MAG: Uma2 family endonuclease [Myxococcaceae bacterium]
MKTPEGRASPATLAEWLSRPPEARLELIDGKLIEKAAPDYLHGRTQLDVAQQIRPWYHHRGGGGRPGGWWIASEVDIVLDGNGYRPDLVGWRRDRVPEMPGERPVRLRPDWICEIVSEANATTDTVKKLRRYHQAGLPHYWLADPSKKTLTVYRHERDGYLAVLAAEAGETVRAEPFDAIELRVGALFGEEDA